MKGCSLEPDPNVTEARTDVGLIRGHAYSITKVSSCKKVHAVLFIMDSVKSDLGMSHDFTKIFPRSVPEVSHIFCKLNRIETTSFTVTVTFGTWELTSYHIK